MTGIYPHETRKTLLFDQDILVTIAGAQIGKCGFIKTEHLPANTNQAVGIVRINKSKAHPRFVFYFFKQPSTFSLIQSLGAQAAQPNLNLERLGQIEIPRPPYADQCHIADLLSTYDNLIVNNQRRMALLEEAARQLYREWFVRLRFPGYEHVQINKGMPVGWKKTMLGEICNEIREVVSPTQIEPETPYIGLEHMPRRSISLTDWGRADAVSSSKHRYIAGDILFGKIRPYFHKVGIAFTDGVASSDAIVIRASSDNLRPFVLLTVSSDTFVAEASQTMKEGSKMPRADWKLMMRYPVAIPGRALIETFANSVIIITEQLKTLCFQNQKLRAARDLLLPRLMSGEIAA